MKPSIKTLAFTLVSTFVLGAALTGCNGGGDTPKTEGDNTKPPVAGGTTAVRPVPPSEGPMAEGDTIKIGTVCSVTGDNKPWGEDSYEGSKLAVEEFNAAGGLGGKKVELILGDSASKPDQAKTATEKLMSQGVIALIGEVSSGNTIQMAKSAFLKGIPVVAVGATRTDLGNEGTHVFRVCYSDDFQGPVMAQFAYANKNLRNVAVMTDNSLPYSQGLSKSFITAFEKLGGKVKEHFYASGAGGNSNYSGNLTEIKGENPDGLFLSGYFTEVGPIVNQARAAGITVPVMGGDGWDSDLILASGGDAIIGGYFCNHYNNADNRPQVIEFLKKWRAKHNGKDPGTTMGALGYDAMAITLNALKNAKTVGAKGILDALEDTVDYKAVSGDITLKGMNGNPDKRAIVVEITKKDAAGNWQKFAKDFVASDIKK